MLRCGCKWEVSSTLKKLLILFLDCGYCHIGLEGEYRIIILITINY